MFRLASFAAVSGLILIAAGSPDASAAPVCGPHDKIAATLGEKFNEHRKSLGIAGGASVIELFVSVKGTWTLTATNTKGTACIIAAGEAWQDAPSVVAGLES